MGCVLNGIITVFNVRSQTAEILNNAAYTCTAIICGAPSQPYQHCSWVLTCRNRQTASHNPTCHNNYLQQQCLHSAPSQALHPGAGRQGAQPAPSLPHTPCRSCK